MAIDLTARLGQAELPNPILTASGCAGAGRELAQFLDVSKIVEAPSGPDADFGQRN